MYICRLFHRDQPFEQLEARLLADDPITIGRDPEADWSLGDTDPTLSRIHCTLGIEGDDLILRDRSTNGVFLDSGERAPKGEPVPVSVRQSLRLGALIILIDRAPQDQIDGNATTVSPAPMLEDTLRVPSDWVDTPAARPAHRDQSLLEAFCEGAKIDASALSAEDPAELMRRVGAIYQQTVLGLATLMADRARMKGAYQLEGTTISASDNNPFKWSPTRRLAQDLLCGGDGAFLSDAPAVRASFEDISAHLNGVARGAQAANAWVIQTLAPEPIEKEAHAHSSFLRGRAAVCWEIHNRRHAALTPGQGADSPVVRVFREAYGRSAEGADE